MAHTPTLKESSYIEFLNNCGLTEKAGKLLRALFEKCFSFNYIGLCVNTGLMLGDKELLHKLIDKESGYYFNVDEKTKVLEFLQEDYGEEVLREFKKLVSSLINKMGDREYKKAAECVLSLRDRMGEDVWKEFRDKGIYLKMKKGEITLNWK